ncbi:hypothetical protein JL720_16442 [Aureococcus anophagefferens]|nr:hypothetical protein JL720_16442 [Aureococcus anophagefferens]
MSSSDSDTNGQNGLLRSSRAPQEKRRSRGACCGAAAAVVAVLLAVAGLGYAGAAAARSSARRVGDLEATVDALAAAVAAGAAADAAAGDAPAGRRASAARRATQRRGGGGDALGRRERDAGLGGGDGRAFGAYVAERELVVHERGAAAEVRWRRAFAALAAEERAYADSLAAAFASIDAAAAALEARIAESYARVDALEGSVTSYEERTDGRFEKQSALLRAWIAGFFALLAVVLTLRHVYAHATKLNRPEAQRKFLLVSSIYEAYTVHMFFALLVAILGGGGGEERALEELPAAPRAPFAVFGAARVSRQRFLRDCKLGTLQFVVVKPALSVLDYAFSYTALGGGELVDWRKPELWITILLNVSVSVALTALLKFFHATHASPRLEAHRPWPKFLSIKGVVFMTWFQGVLITLALRFKLGPLADAGLAKAFQNFLVCVEMFVAALAHSAIFGADEWQADYVPVRVAASSLGDQLAINDIVKDFKSVMPARLRRQRRWPDPPDGAAPGPPGRAAAADDPLRDRVDSSSDLIMDDVELV